MSAERLVHHELCFGCGRTNLFGLLMDVEATGEGQVRGRAFVKQDHQGAVPGTAHDGILAAALSEAMSFAAGKDAAVASLELQMRDSVPVGAFIDLDAGARVVGQGRIEASATASVEHRPVASARAVYEVRKRRGEARRPKGRG